MRTAWFGHAHAGASTAQSTHYSQNSLRGIQGKFMSRTGSACQQIRPKMLKSFGEYIALRALISTAEYLCPAGNSRQQLTRINPGAKFGISDAKNIVRRGLKPQSGPGIIRAAQSGPLMRVERFCGSVIHTAHSTHTAHATATRHTYRRFLLGRFGDHRLRRDEETGN